MLWVCCSAGDENVIKLPLAHNAWEEGRRREEGSVDGT